jgi:hypothetical protein
MPRPTRRRESAAARPMTRTRRPVDEAGGGQAEGFEQAEEDLRENAEHGQLGPRDPGRDAFTPEEESDLAGGEYAEADDARTQDRPDEP